MSHWSGPEVAETLSILAAAGVPANAWTVLSRSNRLVLKLAPGGWIAKAVRIGDAARLVRELSVANHVAAQHGPAAPPVSGRTVLCGEKVAVSLWEPIEALAPPTDPEVCHAYLDLRRGLDSYSGVLPDFREAIIQAADFLDTRELSCLSGKDQTLLHASYSSAFARLSSLRWTKHVLHGDPHAGNVARTRHGLRWLDFESACLGPVEWDLSALPGSVRARAHDPALLAVLARLRSACVVVWCASKPHPDDAEAEAIVHHLEALRAERPT